MSAAYVVVDWLLGSGAILPGGGDVGALLVLRGVPPLESSGGTGWWVLWSDVLAGDTLLTESSLSTKSGINLTTHLKHR